MRRHRPLTYERRHAAQARRQHDGEPRRCPTGSARKRSTITAWRRPGSSPWSRPSRWRPSATCRSPTRPGVAAACELIAADPLTAAEVTARGNLVAVVTNGTAVLGLGAIGALASKPVMEGKAVLFKKFAGIDSFDIEIDERDPDKLVDIVAALEPTFGAINLEDIKAPECFIVESKLRERMQIPVFHDDQHGTAIIVAAAVRNGLHPGRQADRGGAAGGQRCRGRGARLPQPAGRAWACGSRTSSSPTSRAWSTRAAPTLMDPWKASYARPTALRTLAEAIEGADIFLGLSAAGRAQARDGGADGRPAADPGAGQPRPRRSCPSSPSRSAPTRSSPPAAATTRTRSTTSSASRSSSAAPWTSAPRRSTRR